MVMSIIISNQSDSPFDAIRRFDEHGNEFWQARELMPVLGYKMWQKFKSVIENAKENIETVTQSSFEHFLPVEVKSQGRTGLDYKLSRLACYHVALCCDSRGNDSVKMAKHYFAIKTREAETVIPAQNDRVRELELELQLVQAQTQKFLAEKNVLDTRHLIVATCSEPVQQKILGYTEIKTIEYRDRILHEEEILRDGSTISRSEACRRLGMMKGKQPDCKRLDAYLAQLPSDATKLSAVVQEYTEVNLEYWNELKQLWLEDQNRQPYLCEQSRHER